MNKSLILFSSTILLGGICSSCLCWSGWNLDPGFAKGFRSSDSMEIQISIIDQDGDSPLSEAEVFLVDLDRMPLSQGSEHSVGKFGIEQYFFEVGQVNYSDAKGQVQFARPSGRFVVAGRTATHFGVSEVLSEKNEYTLTLSRVECLPVLVVDEENVPVPNACIKVWRLSDRESKRSLNYQTGLGGVAQIQLTESMKQEWKGERIVVTLEILGNQPIEKTVSLDPIPSTPLVLVIPPTGVVEVVVLNSKGRPSDNSHTVWLSSSLSEREGELQSQVNQRPKTNRVLVNRTRQGHVAFHHVLLHQEIRATVMNSTLNIVSTVHGPGPSLPNQKAILTAAPSLEYAVLQGRIVNEKGSVGRGISFLSVIREQEGIQDVQRFVEISTDKEGRFSLPINVEEMKFPHRTLTVRIHKTKHKPMREVIVDIGQMSEAGVYNLGDLVLSVPPLLAEGIVLGVDGQPLKDTTVSLQWARPLSKNDVEEIRWDQITAYCVQTDSRGHFIVRGQPGDVPLRLVVKEPFFEPVAQEFLPGEMDIVLRLAE